MNYTEVEVEKEFSCNMCEGGKACVDGKTIYESWAYMCEPCFKIYGVGLGLGKGQKLKLKRTENEQFRCDTPNLSESK